MLKMAMVVMMTMTMNGDDDDNDGDDDAHRVDKGGREKDQGKAKNPEEQVED